MDEMSRTVRCTRWIGRSTVAVVVLLFGWLAGPGAAGAEAAGVVADWRMDERRGSTTLVDSSGNAHHGRIGAGVITEYRLPEGVVHRFPYVRPPAGATGHVHTVADHPTLDPGAGSFAVTVRFRTTRSYENIVQKGQSGTSGGLWKVEIHNGELRCLYRGSGGSGGVGVRGANDGGWHTAACVRRDGRVRLELDGREVASTVDDAGTVANSWELAIGGKSRCNQTTVSCDLFSGDIDWVRVDDGIVK
jgi:hypothetical protein